jgi:autolysin (N-acetylmuramoyl-L-alanine amidase) (mureinhydrolase) (mucopeptide aminohydrolase) (cell wall hydrolase)
MEIDTSRYREGLPQIGYAPYHQIHAHSTGNKNSTAQNEADYHMRRPVESGFFSHVVGNGRVMQVGPVNNGAYDVGGGWNYETYAAVELIESHSTQEEFMEDYRLYIELLRNLADEAGLPKTLDSDALEGIKSHEYCTNNQPNNFSDHVDPYPYLASWGISREQFKHDIENGLEVKKGWQKNNTGYWYVRSDGSYPKEQFEKIDGTWYYFDGSGYMLADKWKKRPDGTWYYLDKSGEMATDWNKIADKWYYFSRDGAMVKGWVKYRETWYYLDDKDGYMLSKQFVKSGDGWYYLKANGELHTEPAFKVEPDGLITTG